MGLGEEERSRKKGTIKLRDEIGYVGIGVIWVEYLVPLGNTEKGHF